MMVERCNHISRGSAGALCPKCADGAQKRIAELERENERLRNIIGEAPCDTSNCRNIFKSAASVCGACRGRAALEEGD